MDNNPPVPNNGQDPNSGLPAPRPSSSDHALQIARPPSQALALPVPPDDRDEDDIDLLHYWHLLLKRRWHILAVVLFVATGAFIYTLLQTRIYRATVSVQIDGSVMQVVNVGGLNSQGGGGLRDYYMTQLELLRSRALSERVVSDMGLTASEVSKVLHRGTPWQRLKALILGGGSPEGDESQASTASGGEQLEAQRKAAALFRAGLILEPVQESRMLRIHYHSPDPRFSVKAVNALAEAYVTGNLERRFDSSAYAKTYLEERLQELKVKLEESERQLIKYAEDEGIVSGSERSLDEENLAALNTSLLQARQERIKAESMWRQAEAKKGVVGYFANLAAENIYLSQLQQKRSSLRLEYQDKLRIYKPGYPLMEQLQQQIDEVERQIADEVGEIAATIKAKYEAALGQEQSLIDMLAETKTAALDTQSRSVQYAIFKREVDTNRDLYDGLLKRYMEVGVAAGVETNNIAIIDRADVGYLFAPNMRKNLTSALFLGIALGILLAFLLEYLDDTIKSPQDVESKLKLAHLGMVPKLAKGATVEEAEQDLRSGFAEAYRSLRTALQFSTESGIPSLLLVTSSTPGEGKSTTARVLAKNIAQLGKRVLLIDADLRNPSIHRTMGLDNSKGLSTCLSGAAKPAECIQSGEVANLFMIPAGPLPPSPAELLSGPRMVSLLSQASERYDHVILDAPPVLGLADAPILASISKGTLFVVEAGRSRVSVAQSAVKRLLGARARVLGVVLTKFDSKVAGYGYGYGGYSYLGYEYYSYGGSDSKKRLGRG